MLILLAAVIVWGGFSLPDIYKAYKGKVKYLIYRALVFSSGGDGHGLFFCPAVVHNHFQFDSRFTFIGFALQVVSLRPAVTCFMLFKIKL